MKIVEKTSAFSWKGLLRPYQDRRLLYIFVLGCSSGFPWALIGSNLTGWLADLQVKRADIALMGIVFSVYAINFLWAPLLDRYHLPWLSKRLGQRISWIALMQVLILLGALCLASLHPNDQLLLTGFLALFIAIVSATQDVGIDGYRIDSLVGDASKHPAGASMATIGWWTGYSLPGALGFMNADAIGWSGVYYVLAGIQAGMLGITLFLPEPPTQRDQLQQLGNRRYESILHSPNKSFLQRLLLWLMVSLVEPFAEFFRRNGWRVALLILCFVFFFKVGEAFLGRMSIVFYREIGFSNSQIADYSKLIGWAATVVFTLIGSAINIRFGVVRGLMIGGIAMGASNLSFAVLAIVGPEPSILLGAILIDNFTTAFSTVAFVSLLTVLSGQAFSATQYALLASLGNFSRTSLSAASGWMVDSLQGFTNQYLVGASFMPALPAAAQLHWALFFIVTTLMVIPSLVMLWVLGKSLVNHLNDLGQSKV